MKGEFRQVAAPIRDRAAQDPRALVCAAAISQCARNCFHASMRLPAHCSLDSVRRFEPNDRELCE